VQKCFRFCNERRLRIGPGPNAERKDKGRRIVKTLRKKLQNPFALVAQGFLVGGALFWTTQAEAASFLSILTF
jgi:hypothetical protein